MVSPMLKLIVISVIQGFAVGQTNSIVFGTTAGITMAPTTTLLPNTVCACVSAASCPVGAGIDIRIVNTGPNCSVGQVYCCSSPSGNLVDASCGVRKIPATAHPPGQASYGSYPWQVALLTADNTYVGSGVLITPNHVLTVAHKVAPYLNGGIKVRLGEWDARVTTESYPYQEFGISKIFSHPNFNALNLQNDVAVIRLTGTVPVATSPNINTACLPASSPAANTRCWVSGWGKDAFGPNGNYQSILKEVDVPILSQATCETALRGTRLGQFFILDKNSFFCAGGEAGKDACTGDGGSPLVCQGSSGQWQLTGMVAWGIGCASAGVPGVYVNVLNFKSWIDQQVQSS